MEIKKGDRFERIAGNSIWKIGEVATAETDSTDGMKAEALHPRSSRVFTPRFGDPTQWRKVAAATQAAANTPAPNLDGPQIVGGCHIFRAGDVFECIKAGTNCSPGEVIEALEGWTPPAHNGKGIFAFASSTGNMRKMWAVFTSHWKFVHNLVGVPANPWNQTVSAPKYKKGEQFRWVEGLTVAMDSTGVNRDIITGDIFTLEQDTDGPAEWMFSERLQRGLKPLRARWHVGSSAWERCDGPMKKDAVAAPKEPHVCHYVEMGFMRSILVCPVCNSEKNDLVAS